MAEPTLGRGIALQYELPRDGFAVQEIQRRRAEEDAAINAARKAQQKAIQDIEKYRSEIDKINADATGVLPPYQDDIKAKTVKLFERMKEARAENPNANLRDATKMELYDLQETINRHKLSTESFLKDRQKGVSAPELFEIDPDMDKAAQTASYADWVGLLNSKGSSLGSDFYTTGYLKPKEQLKQTDWRKSLFNYSNQAGKLRTEEGAEFTPESTKKKLFEGWRNTPDYAAAVAEYGSTLPIEKVDQMIYENDWLPLFSYSAARKEKETGDKDKLNISDIRKNVSINIMEAKSTTAEPEAKVHLSPYNVTLPSNIALNIPSTERTIDLKTGKQLNYPGQLAIQGGQVVVSKIKNTKTGKSEFVPVVHSTATIVKKDGTTAKKDVSIPLSELRGQKEIEKNAEVMDEIERLTADLNKPKQSAAAKTRTTKFTVKGKVYNIPNDKVSEFKKDMGIQ